jgi:hypothetical protein
VGCQIFVKNHLFFGATTLGYENCELFVISFLLMLEMCEFLNVMLEMCEFMSVNWVRKKCKSV